MKRDYQKDIEVCEKATRGPWEFGNRENGIKTILTDELDKENWPYLIKVPAGPFVGGMVGAAIPFDSLVGNRQSLANAEFIATAREALPYYIKRCMDLEAQVAQMMEALEDVDDSLENEGVRVS